MKVKFIGKQSEGVTGSQVLVNLSKNKKILIDFGMYQTNNIMIDYMVNNSNFKFKVSEIDYVIIPHLHADHCALLPLLYKRGYRGKFGMVKGSRKILKHMLEDCAYILSKNAKTLSKGKKDYDPIYTLEDVETTMKNIEEYDYFDEVEITGTSTFKFIPSQHIAKAAQVIIHDGKKSKFVYSGDLGNLKKPLLYCEPFEPIRSCTVYCSESTYGERDRVDGRITLDEELKRLQSILDTTQGITLIPCFSLQRTQEIMHYLKDCGYKKYVDSPLSTKITNEFVGLYGLDCGDTQLIDKWEDSVALMGDDGKKVIIASAGMLNAGRSVEWCKRIVSDARNSIVFVGYCSTGTIGAKLQKKPSKIELEHKKPIEVKCRIETLSCFSSHMQREDLIEYLSSINCEKIVLHHGSEQAKADLKEDLDIAISEKLKTTKVIISKKGLEIIV